MLALLYAVKGPYVPETTHRLMQANLGPLDGATAGTIIQLAAGYAAVALSVPIGVALTAMPAIAFLILAIVLVRARFDATFRVSLILATFVAVFVWSNVDIARVDLLGPILLIAALASAEAARTSDSVGWWVVAGAIAALAWLMATWTAGIAGSLVIAVALAPRQGSWTPVLSRSTALVAGGAAVVLVVGAATGFGVVKLAALQTVTWASELSIASGSAMHQSLRDEMVPSVKAWPYRPIVLLLWPLTRVAIAAAVISPILLIARRGTRVLGAALIPPLAGMLALTNTRDIVPAQVLLIPELSLYLAAVFAIALDAAAWVAGRSSREGRLTTALATAAVAILVLQSVPVRMGRAFDLQRGADTMEDVRAAARALNDVDDVVGVTGHAAWFPSGFTYVWDAGNELRTNDVVAPDIDPILDEVQLVTIDAGYPANADDGALLTGTYLSGHLNLASFVVATSPDEALGHGTLFLSRTPARARGYILRGRATQRFEARQGGNSVLAIAGCTPGAVPPDLQDRVFATRFPVAAQQLARADEALVLALGTAARVRGYFAVAADNCRIREEIVGTISTVERPSTGGDDLSYVFDDRNDTVRAARQAGGS